MHKPDRDELDYSSMSIERLCELWDLSQRTQNETLTTELLEEFTRRAERPARVTHDLPRWLHWLPRPFWHQKPVGEGRG